MAISLSTAQTLIDAAFAKGHELDLKPLSVVVLDPRASMVAVMSQDGVSQMRARIAHGKIADRPRALARAGPLFLHCPCSI